ncbi:MAG: dihydrofolate reductase family protein [Bacteroidales bacterium]|jgi:dihydrofolate reductase|nr:dihydrofolate reductase family protein [Bacteroidales bacterium]
MKPKIICYMMSTVDGRLYTTRYSLPFNGEDNEAYLGYYFEMSDQPVGDAVMMGRHTLQESYMPNLFDNKNYRPSSKPETFIARPAGAGIPNIVVDIKGKTQFEDHEEGHFITILGEQVPDEYLAHLREKKVSYLFAGPEGKNLDKAMETLGTAFGLKTIILEGGGRLNGTFLKAGLIDELNLLLYPSIDGLSEIPSIFEYPGKPDEKPADGQALELISVKQEKYGTVLLRYKFHQL